jgi:hypothetical protein
MLHIKYNIILVFSNILQTLYPLGVSADLSARTLRRLNGVPLAHFR